MTSLPCQSPENANETVAHFYDDKSSNTFVVRLIGMCMYSEVHGRNQIENTFYVLILDVVRNKAVAIGSRMRIERLNWLTLVIALAETE